MKDRVPFTLFLPFHRALGGLEKGGGVIGEQYCPIS